MAGTPTETIGSGFSQGVKDQLKARERLFSSKSKTNDQLLYMNGNGAWARMVSSVNTLTLEEVEKLSSVQVGPVCITGNKNLAYNNVLLGGTKKQSNSVSSTKLKGGINYTPGYTPLQINEDLTISEGQLRENIYSNYTSLGYRPGPGIESVSIESQNTYGTLREAKVKIVAWTLEDLEVMQALYMRPGYSMLLEWGHSLYIDKTGKLSKDSIPLYNEFLDNVGMTSRRIEGGLTKKRDDSEGNYDAMYGVVKNFNWSFRQDGGYDCEVVLVSKGSILESLSIKFDASETLQTEEEKEKDADKRTSPFHKFYQDLAKIKEEEGFNKEKLLKQNSEKEKGNYSKLQDFFGIWINLDTSNDLGDLADRGQFISLRTFLDFFNNYVAYVGSNIDDELDQGKAKLSKYYTGQKEEPTGKYLRESKYITTDHHFSIDPMKCLLPKKTVIPEDFKYENIVTVKGALYSLRLGKINTLKEQLQKNIKKGAPDDILNIYLSVHTLSLAIDGIVNEKDKTQHNMFTYVQRMLEQMNSVLGGVNDFDQTYDESTDMWYIVDRKKTPTTDTIKNHTTINLTGLSSTVTNLDISSKISNEISAQVSIAAQGTGNNYKENVSTMLKWNSGLIDRTIPIKSLTQEDIDNNEISAQNREKERIQKNMSWAREVTGVFQEFSTGFLDGSGFINPNIWVTYEEDNHKNLEPGHTRYCSYYVTERYFKDPCDPKPPPGVIPVELSFKTIGIGGLKIGQAFKIADGILPKSYKNFGYIITGLSHSIENSKWQTSVKTQFYNITPPTANEIPDKTDIPEDPKTGDEENIPELDPALDPAPQINTQKIGAISYSSSPLAKDLQQKLNFNGLLDTDNLEFIGETNGAQKYYINPSTGIPEYMLHPAAASAWYKWRDEMKQQGISYRVSSAYRNAKHQGGLDSGRSATPGNSPHGWAGALDFANLFEVVNGSTQLRINLNGRIQSPDYKKIAEIGKKYGWYNPWRLSNNSGTLNEMWHFEYWGAV